MARQPEVFVRSLEPEEAQRLVKITRTTRDRVRLRRAGIVLASVQGRSGSEAAGMFAMKPQYAREVIHAFNEQGFAALDPKWSGGRPARFGPPVRETVCRVAKTPPQQLGRPFTTWSLSKLVEYLAEHKHIKISTESVRQILRAAGVRWQATKTWKGQPGPRLHREDGPRPRSVRPSTSRRPSGLRRRVRPVEPAAPAGPGLVPRRGVRPGCGPRSTAPAEYGTCSPRWTWPPGRCSTGSATANAGGSSSGSSSSSGPDSPAGKLHVICDNFSPHKKAEVVAWCRANDVELVFTPSNASWLNWIECEFTALRYFTLDGSDYPSHTAQENAIAGYVRWRNKRAQPKHASPSTPRSAAPITYPTLLDEALASEVLEWGRWRRCGLTGPQVESSVDFGTRDHFMTTD